MEQQYAIRALAVAKDLAQPEAPNELYAQLKQENLAVDSLVNNAGFATYGLFAGLPWL